MNLLSQNDQELNTYDFRECNLDIETISDTPAYPMISNKLKSIVLNITAIRSIDASGLAWLMDLVKKYQSLGLKVKLTENKIISEAIDFLGLDTYLRNAPIEFTQKVI